MKSFRSKHLARQAIREQHAQFATLPSEEGTVQISQPTPATASAPQPQGNRKQRRRQETFHRRLNNRLKSISAQGLPMKLIVGSDGKPVIRIDLRAAKKAEEAKLAALKESETVTAFDAGVDLGADPTGDFSSETIYDADGKLVSHRVVEED